MIKTMIIEDDPMVRDINCKFLHKIEGFILHKAVSNLNEAKDSINISKPDLILLDIYLSKENGLDFLKYLRAKNIKVDVILITADKSTEAIKEAFRYGAVDYLIKPFTFKRFKEALIQFKERNLNLIKNNELEQHEIDKYIVSGNLNSANIVNNTQLIKGLSYHTYDKIFKAISSWKGEYFTSEELSESLGMARVTVRRYLEYMESKGMIELIIEYGNIGRPQHRYKVK